MPTVGDKISNLTRLESPSADALAYIVDSGDFKVNRDGLKNWIGIGKSGVKLIKGDGTVQFFQPTLNTNSSRWTTALVPALEAATSNSRLYLSSGAYGVPSGGSMSANLDVGVTGVKLFFEEGSSLNYDDPEDSAEDYSFFTFPVNLSNFGLRETDDNGDIQDNWKALQAAANALPPRPDVVYLESGRRLKTGACLILPIGIYYSSKTWEVSPCTVIKGSEDGTIGSVLMPIAGGDFGDYFIKMEDPQQILGVDSFGRNNCFGSALLYIRITQDDPDDNPGLSGVYWYGAQLNTIQGVFINNFSWYGMYLYGSTIHQLWITNCGRTGLIWTTGGTCELLSVERCNPTEAIDGTTGRKYPQIDISGGAFTLDHVQSEDWPDGSNGTIESMTLVWAHDVTLLTVGGMDIGCPTVGARTHTLLLLTGGCHNVNVHGLKCFPATLTDQTLVNDLSQQSPNGPGVSYLLMGNSGQYNQIDGGKPASKVLTQTWTGQNTFEGQSNFGTVGSSVSFLFQSPTGIIYLSDGKYETSRSTSYFGAALPRPTDWNAGAMTLSTSGVLNVTGEYQVDGTKVIGNQGVAVADATLDLSSVQTQLNALLARFRAHGLIAT